MKREILVFGIILLFVGLAVSPSIYADRDKVSLKEVYDRSLDRFELGNIVFKLFFNNMRLLFLLLFAPSNPSESYLMVVYNRCLDAFSSLDDRELDLLFESINLEDTEIKDNLMFVLDNDLDYDDLLEENDCLDCGCNSDIIDFDLSRIITCIVLFIPFLFGYLIWKIFEAPWPLISIISFIGFMIALNFHMLSHDLDLNCFWEILMYY